MEFFGLKDREIPSLRLITLHDEMTKYKRSDDRVDKDAVSEFVQDFLDGKLKVSIRYYVFV